VTGFHRVPRGSRRFHDLLTAIALALVASMARAQTPDAGRLIVTVTDQSGGVIPNATVSVQLQDGAAASTGTPPRSATTSEGGVATVEGLKLGRYTIDATFPGFEPASLRDVRVGSGSVKRTIVLPIKKVAENVTVDRDKQSSALDPRGNSFSTVLTREQIAALPDDPDEMESVLKAMAPPGAQMRVDGFTGGKLPPKSQIRSIRLPRMDQIAAQNHGGLNGLLFIDVMTQPGNGPLRGSLDFTYRDDALNAQNPFTPVKGDEGLHQGGFGLSGSVVPNKSSFSLQIQGANQFDSTNLLAALPGQTVAAPIRRPTDRTNVYARFDQGITKDHLARVTFQRAASQTDNLGVGGYDLPGRAYSTTSTDNQLRFTENGPLGRRFFSESRLQLHWTGASSTSSVELPTLRVLDAFTSGGAQQAGGRHALEFEAASDLDYVRGKHSFRTGVLLEGGSYRTDEAVNYLGTYTFASLADYDAGRPSTFTRRTGDPLIAYHNLQVGVYAQDDFRLSKSLMFSYGLRYEAQTLIADQLNFSPRVTISWSPRKSGKTTFRAGYGRFTDWLGLSTYEQTLRIDGVHQQEINIIDPTYPTPGTIGTTPPTNRYFLDPSLVLPESQLANVGVDQVFGSARVSATYTMRRGSNLLRGLNQNVPVNGVRPDPEFANVIDVVGDAAQRGSTIVVTGSFIKLDWHQTFLAGSYAFSTNETNTTGAFAPPATADRLDLEWGPIAPRHRAGGSINTSPIRNLSVNANVRAQSGTPYNITTGVDTNNDGMFTDRPVGVSRNSARTAMQWDLGLRVGYTIGFGPRPATSGGGGPQAIVINAGGGGMPGGFSGGAADHRYRIELYASVQNVTNHNNYVGYSGTITSPFFAEPTNVLNPRKTELGLRFAF
jgi:carboxypeptidase family protein